MTDTTSFGEQRILDQAGFDLDYAMIDRNVTGLNAESFRSPTNVLNLLSHSRDKIEKHIEKRP
jgi:hypothetical protein